MGYCPFCLIMTQYKAGCRTHGCNKEDLLTELPVNKDELLEKHKAQSLIGPPAKVRAVMAKLGLKTSEGFSDEEVEAEEQETDQVVEDASAVASPRGRAVAGGGLDDALRQLRMVSLEKAAHTDSDGPGVSNLPKKSTGLMQDEMGTAEIGGHIQRPEQPIKKPKTTASAASPRSILTTLPGERDLKTRNEMNNKPAPSRGMRSLFKGE